MKMQFIPLDYGSFDWKGRNYVKITGRNENNKRVCVIDTCPIYLWAILTPNVNDKKIEELKTKIRKIEIEGKLRKTTVEKIEVHEKKFLEHDVKALKIFATNYKDLHDIASKLDFPEIDKRRGYDLGFINHYIIESKLKPLFWYEIKGEVLNNSLEYGGIDNTMKVDFCIDLKEKTKIKKKEFEPKVLGFDIETDALEIGKGEILMFSLYGKNLKKVVTFKKIKGKKPDYVEYVQDERDLLEKFIDHIKKYSPDFLVGYFSDGFDLPYIKARAQKHNLRLPLGVDGSQLRFSKGNQTTAKIFGIIHIDILRFIKTAYAQYMQSETLTLNEVAKEFLGDSKVKFELKHSSKIKEKDWKEYYKYNLQDSLLTFELLKRSWIDLMEFSRTINQPPFETCRAGLSKYIESYILNNLEKYNEIPEKKPSYNESGKRKGEGAVEGAFVLQTTPGLYENIAIFDFTSMHTSIIISRNLSKGTLLEKKEKGAIESPELELKGKKEKFYFSKKPGFFPKLLEEIFEKRKKFKEEFKKNPNQITKARSNAFKVLSASAHGYIGFFGARYYSKETSAAILAFVRYFNKETIEKVKKEGFAPIFADTDSVGFLMNEKSEKEIKEFLNKLNNSLPGVMHLELEGFFKRGLWVTTRGGTTGAKKKYALIDKEGKIKIRGFETVRRDWCKLSRDMQNKVLRLILKEGNGKKALEYVKEIIQKVKCRKIDKKELMIRTALKKPISEYKANTPHVVAARKMREQNLEVAQGGLIEYYLAETSTKSKLVRDKVKLPDEKGKYEIEYYLEKQILPAVENIFQVLGIDTKELIDGKRQDKLSKWF